MAAGQRRQQRDGSKERHWRRMLREWQRSGLSVREFCDWQDLSEPSFYAWRREIAKRDREAAADRSGSVAESSRHRARENAVVPSPAFVPVRIVADEPAQLRSAHCLEVRLPTGVQLRVPAGFDRQTLADVLAALERRPWEQRPC